VTYPRSSPTRARTSSRFNDDLHGFHPNQVTFFDELVDADNLKGAPRESAFLAACSIAVLVAVRPRLIPRPALQPSRPRAPPVHGPARAALCDGRRYRRLNPHLSQQLVVCLYVVDHDGWLTKFDHDNRRIPQLTTVVATQANGGISKDG